MLGVLNDILDFSKIEAGKLELESVPFNLQEVVEDVLDLFGEKAYGKGVELYARIDPACPTMLIGDPGRFRQILLNLVGNAVKFTERGEVGVAIEASKSGEEAVRLHCVVSDTGIGIDAVAQQRIFESFSQGDNSTTRLYGGTGLGLAIVRQLVALMDGQTALSSTPGQGSHFSFSIRLGAPLQLQPEIAPILPGGGEVLIWDDHRATRELLAAALAGLGLTPLVVASGAELRRLLTAPAARIPFRFALLDLTLPETESGMLAELRRSPLLVNTRLILLVPHAMPSQAGPDAQTTSGDGFLFKPLRLSLLRQVLLCAEQGHDQTPPQAVLLPPTPVVPLAHRRQRKILVAEDNLTTQRLISLILEASYRLEMVGNGQDVLERAEADRYDLILMDCQMPGLDGFAATRLLRARNDATPIIALTAHAQPEDAERCLAQGMNDYLSKPFKQQQLLDLVAKWLPN